LRIIGIDPGLKGGIALLEDGLIVKLARMPLTEIETKTKKLVRDMTKAEKKLHKQKKTIFETKIIVNSKAVYNLVLEFEPDLVVIEKPFYLGIESRKSTATSAENVGRLYGIAEGLGHKILRVQGSSWKPYYDLGDDKEAAITKAEELFPHVNLVPPRCRKKQDGLAEALLLAVYGSRPSKEDF
jgi:hypothetical protein